MCEVQSVARSSFGCTGPDLFVRIGQLQTGFCLPFGLVSTSAEVCALPRRSGSLFGLAIANVHEQHQNIELSDQKTSRSTLEKEKQS